MKDKDRLDWLEKEGNGIALINDDFGNWAVLGDGHQPLCEAEGEDDWSTTYFNNKEQKWFKTAREAIDHAMEVIR